MTDLINHLDKIHTTELGTIRIKRNLNLDSLDVINYCKNIIKDKNSKISRIGKNFYIENGKIKITVNAQSYTIITAHIIK